MRSFFKNKPYKSSPNLVSLSQERYMNLDSSPYGATGAMRFIMNPYVQTNVVVGIFSAVGQALLAPPAIRQSSFVYYSAIDLATFLVMSSYDLYSFYNVLPISKDAVIDKSGRTVNDIAGTIKLARHYRERAQKSLFVGIFSAASLYATVQHVHPYAANYAVNALLLYYASIKLLKNQWTLQTNPPPLSEKRTLSVESAFQTVPIARRTISAFTLKHLII